MQNSDVAHRFFYDRGGQFERRSMTVSYGYDKYWSYGTVIGKITEDINGNTVCIISETTFSNTTAKHLGELRRACPFNTYYLPQKYGNSDFYANEIIETLKHYLDYFSKAKLSQKYNRESFTTAYEQLHSTLQLAMFKEHFKDIKKTLKSYESLYNDINNPEKLKELKAIQAKREKQQREKLKKQLNKIFKTYDYLTIIENAYHYYYDNAKSIFDKETRDSIKKYLNPKNDLSFVWFENDAVRTSQHITVDKKEAITLLKLWLKGKVKHGMTISHYTVLEVMPEYVKIGCHKIPVENLKALAAAMETQKEAA